MESLGQELIAALTSEDYSHETVKRILEKGADPCLQHGSPCSPVFAAVEKDDPDLLGLLLPYAALEGLQRPNETGLTPLMLAAMLGRSQCASLLIAALSGHPDALNTSIRGNSALSLALGESRDNIAIALLDAGANPNVRDWKGRCPVHAAAVRGRLDVLELLRRHGAVLNVRDDHGNTPMHFCAQPAVLEYLCEEGLDPRAKNDKGCTPADILGRLHVNPAVIDTLKKLEERSTVHRFLGTVRKLSKDVVNDLGWKIVFLVLALIAVIAWQLAVHFHGSPFVKTVTKNV